MVDKITRRRFMFRAARTSVGLSLAATVPGLLAACSDDDGSSQGADGESRAPGSATPEQAQREATVLVGDVLDFRLVNDEGWQWAVAG